LGGKVNLGDPNSLPVNLTKKASAIDAVVNITRRRQTPPDLAKLKSHICHAVKALYTTQVTREFSSLLTGCIVDISLIFSNGHKSPHHKITHVNKDNFFSYGDECRLPPTDSSFPPPPLLFLFLGVVGSVVVCVSLVFLLTVNKMMMINEQKTNKQTRFLDDFLPKWTSQAWTNLVAIIGGNFFPALLYLNSTPGDNGGAPFKTNSWLIHLLSCCHWWRVMCAIFGI
jgi:hypothetical protein